MTTTITSRISTTPVASNTQRVATVGATAASPATYGGATWLGWGNTWGNRWRSINPGTGAVAASPAIDVTARVSSSPTANNTKRITEAVV